MPKNTTENLTIAFRYRSELGASKEDIEAFIGHLRALNPTKIICATPKSDLSIQILKQNDIEVTEYEDFNKLYLTNVISDFYERGSKNYLLIISFGIILDKWQLEHAVDFIRSRNLLCTGWRILHQENDGTYIGKLSYNTCMLHSPQFYPAYLKVGGIPEYVTNGYLGTITVNLDNTFTEIKIGGQEELAIQLRLYKSYFGKKHILFGHINHYGLERLKSSQNANSLNSKIVRKVITAEIYRKIENVNPKDFMDSWQII